MTRPRRWRVRSTVKHRLSAGAVPSWRCPRRSSSTSTRTTRSAVSFTSASTYLLVPSTAACEKCPRYSTHPSTSTPTGGPRRPARRGLRGLHRQARGGPDELAQQGLHLHHRRSPFCAARKKAGRSCDIVAEFLASCDKYKLSRGITTRWSTRSVSGQRAGGHPAWLSTTPTARCHS
jgi:hypothetical protein